MLPGSSEHPATVTLFTAAELALIYDVFAAEKMAFSGKVHAELHGIMTKLPLMHAEAGAKANASTLAE